MRASSRTAEHTADELSTAVPSFARARGPASCKRRWVPACARTASFVRPLKNPIFRADHEQQFEHTEPIRRRQRTRSPKRYPGRHRPAPGPDQLRRPGLLAVPAQGLHQGLGLYRCRARAAGDRHRRYRQRLQPLPRQHAAAGRGRQTRHPAGRRAADAVPDDLDPRELRRADQHGAAQPDVDRYRGDDPRAADGRGGADRRLRQDRAGATDGCRLGGRAGDPAGDRRDADRLASRRSGSVPVPIAAATGASSARARSTRTRPRRSTTSWSPASAPVR